MGLDMYLSAKKRVYSFSFEKDKTGYAAAVKAFGLPEDWKLEDSPMGCISLNVAYWRKANQIHAWFVKNVQKGVDDCGYYSLEPEKLHELLTVCKKVKESPYKAAELLPTQTGFFFGDTDYGEYYQEDIDNTIKQLEAVLNNPVFLNCDFEYHSSW